MYIYKFRITSDEIEDFIRDIEILSNQTFEQLHYYIVETLEFKQSELASFFICDQKWRRKHEITLIDMGDDDSFTDDDDEDSSLKHKIPRTIMQNSVLNQHIDDPHQRISYEYDYTNPFIFNIELIKTTQAMQGIDYPRCTQVVGKLPETKNIVFPIIGEIDGDLDLIQDFGDDVLSDFDDDINTPEIYENDFDTDEEIPTDSENDLLNDDIII